jgi:hypothetical protein
MAPPTKAALAAAAARKKSGKSGLVVTLKVSPDALGKLLDPPSVKESKEESLSAAAKDSPATSTTLPAPPASNEEQPASDSSPNTPGDVGTPSQTVAQPPTEAGPKKRGGKRSAVVANGDGVSDVPKVRGKPGPKKRKL